MLAALLAALIIYAQGASVLVDDFLDLERRAVPDTDTREQTADANHELPSIGIFPVIGRPGQEGRAVVRARWGQPGYCPGYLPPRRRRQQGLFHSEWSAHRQQASQGWCLWTDVSRRAEALIRLQVEVIIANADLIPQPKTLAQRIAQPKAQPKSAAAVKHNANGKNGAAAGKGAKKAPGKRAKSGRPAKKTAEELDSEMTDYFNSANNENANGAAAPAAAGGDAPMEDEIL
jgi:hypothetical protein